jgi:hypothetical protein
MDKLLLNASSLQMNYNESKDALDERAKRYKVDKIIPEAWKKTLYVLGFAVSAVWAAYLSWKCSGYKQSVLWRRVLSAGIAASFNIFYVLYYFMSRSDVCYIIKRVNEIKGLSQKINK